MLLAPALWNGFPLLQYDAGRLPGAMFEGYLVPSRPAAYGLLLAAGRTVYVLADAAVPGHVRNLDDPFAAAGIRARWATVPAVVIAGLSLTTTLPFVTSMLLTDICRSGRSGALRAGIGRRLARWERIGIALIAAFAVATHSATLALIAALVAVALIAAVRATAVPPRGLPCTNA